MSLFSRRDIFPSAGSVPTELIPLAVAADCFPLFGIHDFPLHQSGKLHKIPFLFLLQTAGFQYSCIIFSYAVGGNTVFATSLIGAGRTDFISLQNETNPGIFLKMFQHLLHMSRKSVTVSVSFKKGKAHQVVRTKRSAAFIPGHISVLFWKVPAQVQFLQDPE